MTPKYQVSRSGSRSQGTTAMHSCTVRHQILWYAYPVRVPDGYGRGTHTLESILKKALGRHP